MEDNKFIGPIPVWTTVKTSFGLGWIIGQIVDPSKNIVGYLVSFDYSAPAMLRENLFVSKSCKRKQDVSWIFRPGEIIIYQIGDSEYVN